MSVSNVHFIVGDAQFCTYYIKILNFTWSDVTTETSQKGRKKKGKSKTIDFVSRFLEETSKAGAHQQEKLLEEEDPGDLVEWGAGLAAQVQDGGSQEGHAKAKAEEGSPVGEGGLQVTPQQRHDVLVQQLHVATRPATHTHTRTLRLKRWQWIKWNT